MRKTFIRNLCAYIIMIPSESEIKRTRMIYFLVRWLGRGWEKIALARIVRRKTRDWENIKREDEIFRPVFLLFFCSDFFCASLARSVLSD